MTWNRFKSLVAKPEFVGWLLVAVGLILRMRQYIANRSFWHDEANLALNLVNRSFGGLTQPLDYDQGAPLGFLFVEKFLITVLGNKDYILRLFPLFAGLLATYLIYRLAREYFAAAWPFAVLMFAISWPLIYYSSELKQYSNDAMFALLLPYLSFRCLSENADARDYLRLGITGVIAIWVSHPSAFVLAGIGVVLFGQKLIKKTYKLLAWTLGLGAAWPVSFGVAYLVSLRYLVADQSLLNYWRNGFMPFPPWRHLDWLTQAYQSLLGTTSPAFDLQYLVLGFSALVVIGMLSLLLRNRGILLIMSLPFLLALAASALQKYPLKGRFMLFLVPLLILLSTEGLGRIYSLINKWRRLPAIFVPTALALIVIWMPAGSAIGNFLTPPVGDDIKPVMQYVQDNRSGSDVVYVYHGARPSFNYYAPFYGLDTGNVVTGVDLADVPALKQFYNQVNRLQGQSRVWFIFSHIVDCGGCEGDMEAFYIRYLNQLGSVEDEFHASGANVYLYNLSSK